MGGNDNTPHQGMLKDSRIFTIQGHPEFNPTVVTALINRREKNGIFDKETAEKMRQSLNKEINEVLVLDTALRYLALI
jgi:GMP synthase-like glutamine amidotransferase